MLITISIPLAPALAPITIIIPPISPIMASKMPILALILLIAPLNQ